MQYYLSRQDLERTPSGGVGERGLGGPREDERGPEPASRKFLETILADARQIWCSFLWLRRGGGNNIRTRNRGSGNCIGRWWF